MDADNLGRYLLVLTNHDVYGGKVFAAAATLLANAKDLVDGELFPIVFVVDSCAFLYHGYGIQSDALTAMSCAGLENHVSNRT